MMYIEMFCDIFIPISSPRLRHTLHIHVHVVTHSIFTCTYIFPPAPIKRIKKRYMDDESSTVPRSTLYRWKRKKVSDSNAKRSLYNTSNNEGNFGYYICDMLILNNCLKYLTVS